jgi:hypothetical protein
MSDLLDVFNGSIGSSPCPTSSTQPFSSSPPSQLTTPILHNRQDSIPPNLLVTSLDRRDRYAYFSTDSISKKAFEEWWASSSWSTSNPDSNIRWGSHSRSSNCWDHFQEIAAWPGGEPRVRCTHCNRQLTHPAGRQIGTSTMTGHLKSKKCPVIDRLLVPSSSSAILQNWLKSKARLYFCFIITISNIFL